MRKQMKKKFNIWARFSFYVYTRPFIHLLYFIYARTHVEITRQWKSILRRPPFRSALRDWSLFIAGRGRGDWGLNKVKFSRSPLWTLLHWSDPPNNFWSRELSCFWWLSRSPKSLFAKKIWVPPPASESFQSLQQSLLLGSQLRLILPFVLLRIKWFPLKSFASPPPPKAPNNDRTLECLSYRESNKRVKKAKDQL